MLSTPLECQEILLGYSLGSKFLSGLRRKIFSGRESSLKLVFDVFQEWIGLKEWSVGLRSTSTTSPGKDNGDVPPLGLPSHEAISQISFCVCPLPGTPNWQTEVNKYVALEVGQKVPPEAEALFLAGRGSFQQLEGMNVMGAGGCPYLRYKD